MYLTGSYHSDWKNVLHMRNTSNESKKFQIEFFDEKGSTILELKPIEINSFGLKLVRLDEIKELKNQNGLFIIWAESGIKGEQYLHSSDGAPLRTVKTLDEGLPPFNSKGLSVFISYAMRPENDHTYDLISRFVKTLGFTVLSAKESGRMELPPGTQISEMISEAHVMIALLTKDMEAKSNDGKMIFLPSMNVIDEIGQGSDMPIIILVEEGIEVPSNIQTRSTYVTFSREKLGEMLISLMENIKAAGFT